MNHSPAYILTQYLIDQGVLSDPSLSGSWPVYVGTLPDKGNTAGDYAAILNTAPLKDGRPMGGVPLFHHGVQIVFRSSEYNTGYSKAQALATLLSSVDGAVVEVEDFISYVLHSVTQATGVIAAGQGAEKRRWTFTVGFLVTILEVVGGKLIPLRFIRDEAFPPSLCDGRVIRRPAPYEEPVLVQYTGSGLLDDAVTPIDLEFSFRVGIVNVGGPGLGVYNWGGGAPPGLFLEDLVVKVSGSPVYVYTYAAGSSDEIYVLPTTTILMYIIQGTPSYQELVLEFTGGSFPDVNGDIPDDISIAAAGWGDIDVSLTPAPTYDGKITTWVKTGTGGP